MAAARVEHVVGGQRRGEHRVLRREAIVVAVAEVDRRPSLRAGRHPLQPAPQLPLIVLPGDRRRRIGRPLHQPASGADLLAQRSIAEIRRKRGDPVDVPRILLGVMKRPEAAHRDAEDPHLFMATSPRRRGDIGLDAPRRLALQIISEGRVGGDDVDRGAAALDLGDEALVAEGARAVTRARQEQHQAARLLARRRAVDRRGHRRRRAQQAAAEQTQRDERQQAHGRAMVSPPGSAPTPPSHHHP